MRNIHGKNAEAARELQAWAEQHKLSLDVLELDITEESSVRQAVEKVIAQTGHIDVLVNNAGVALSGIVEAFTIEQAQAR